MRKVPYRAKVLTYSLWTESLNLRPVQCLPPWPPVESIFLVSGSAHHFQAVTLLFLSLLPPTYWRVDLPLSKWQRDPSSRNHHKRPFQQFLPDLAAGDPIRFCTSHTSSWFSMPQFLQNKLSPHATMSLALDSVSPSLVNNPKPGESCVEVPHKERDIMRG